MSDIELNRKRHFGVVYGDPEIGYEQDRNFFRHDGSLHTRNTVPLQVRQTDTGPAQAPDWMLAFNALSDQIKALASIVQGKPSVKAQKEAKSAALSAAAKARWAERRATEKPKDPSDPVDA